MVAPDVQRLAAVVVEDQVVFTLTALCRASGAEDEQVRALVFEGVLLPSGQRPDEWRFEGHALRRTRTALRLARDLELGFPALAVVMDLLAEVEHLRARLRRG